MSQNSILAERLSAARKKNKYTQEEIAEFLKCGRATITNYENGRRSPDYETLVKLAKKYNVTTDYLLGLTGAETTNKDIRYICDYTGLAVEAVKELNNIKRTLDKESNVSKENEFMDVPSSYYKLFLSYISFSTWYADEFVVDSVCYRLMDYCENMKQRIKIQDKILSTNISDYETILKLNNVLEKLNADAKYLKFLLFESQQIKIDLYLLKLIKSLENKQEDVSYAVYAAYELQTSALRKKKDTNNGND